MDMFKGIPTPQPSKALQGGGSNVSMGDMLLDVGGIPSPQPMQSTPEQSMGSSMGVQQAPAEPAPASRAPATEPTDEELMAIIEKADAGRANPLKQPQEAVKGPREAMKEAGLWDDVVDRVKASFAQSKEGQANILRAKWGKDNVKVEGDKVMVKKGKRGWEELDPSGIDMGDFNDLIGDAVEGVMYGLGMTGPTVEAAAMTSAAAAGTGGMGAIPAAIAATGMLTASSVAATALADRGRTNIANMMGANEPQSDFGRVSEKAALDAGGMAIGHAAGWGWNKLKSALEGPIDTIKKHALLHMEADDFIRSIAPAADVKQVGDETVSSIGAVKEGLNKELDTMKDKALSIAQDKKFFPQKYVDKVKEVLDDYGVSFDDSGRARRTFKEIPPQRGPHGEYLVPTGATNGSQSVRVVEPAEVADSTYGGYKGSGQGTTVPWSKDAPREVLDETYGVGRSGGKESGYSAVGPRPPEDTVRNALVPTPASVPTRKVDVTNDFGSAGSLNDLISDYNRMLELKEGQGGLPLDGILKKAKLLQDRSIAINSNKNVYGTEKQVFGDLERVLTDEKNDMLAQVLYKDPRFAGRVDEVMKSYNAKIDDLKGLTEFYTTQAGADGKMFIQTLVDNPMHKPMVKNLRDTLGENSVEWKQFQAAYLDNLMKSEEITDPHSGIFKADKFYERLSGMDKETRKMFVSEADMRRLHGISREFKALNTKEVLDAPEKNKIIKGVQSLYALSFSPYGKANALYGLVSGKAKAADFLMNDGWRQVALQARSEAERQSIQQSQAWFKRLILNSRKSNGRYILTGMGKKLLTGVLVSGKIMPEEDTGPVQMDPELQEYFSE